MKLKFMIGFFVLFFITGRSFAQMSYLDIGSEMYKYPEVEWLKGEPVKTFEKDKIYVIELWATWCGPCVAQMPHINQLARKFENANVVFIGQNVMEPDRTKVVDFVQKKGDGMGYRIAFSGPSGSHFEKEWLKPAGVISIPQTFLIQDNKLLWQTTPNMLNEEVIQLLIDHKFSIEAAMKINEKGSH